MTSNAKPHRDVYASANLYLERNRRGIYFESAKNASRLNWKLLKFTYFYANFVTHLMRIAFLPFNRLFLNANESINELA